MKFAAITVAGWAFALPFLMVTTLLPLQGEIMENKKNLKTAVFAGGCFWCMESDFKKVPGVMEVRSGFTGGAEIDPTYELVSAGRTGHTEAVAVRYDPEQVSYAELLARFWVNIDPTVKDAQFCDTGPHYRTGIFYRTAEEEQLAQESKQKAETQILEQKPFFTEISAFKAFYVAEDYHQDYAKKNPIRYNLYRYGCGRDRRLSALWGELAGKKLN